MGIRIWLIKKRIEQLKVRIAHYKDYLAKKKDKLTAKQQIAMYAWIAQDKHTIKYKTMELRMLEVKNGRK